jgi:hypothetical protein
MVVSMSIRHLVADVLLLTIVGPVPGMAQRESASRWGDQFDFRFSRPTVLFEYGASIVSQDGLPVSLRKPAMVQFKIGGLRSLVFDAPIKILQHRFDFFSIAYLAPRLRRKGENTGIRTELIRFGPGFEKSYGYGFGRGTRPPSVSFYHSEGLLWSRLNVLDNVADDSSRAMLNLYQGAFRFGSRAEGGVRVHLASFLALDGSYERAVMFRRHQVLKWMGSALLEAMAHWLLDRVVDKIGTTVPAVLPVVSFVLKNALSYGIYELRSTRMFYPFTSEAPLMINTVKGGLTFIF